MRHKLDSNDEMNRKDLPMEREVALRSPLSEGKGANLYTLQEIFPRFFY